MKPGQLSKHFHRSEFACKCGCGFDVVDAEIIRILENIHIVCFLAYQSRIRIIIKSGNRCVEHNEEIQKQDDHYYVAYSSKSMHMKARACDFKIEYLHFGDDIWVQINPSEIADYLETSYPDSYGIGRYNGRTHLDTRSTKARWDRRKI